MAVATFNDVLAGGDFPFRSIPEADRGLRDAEKQFTTRRQVLDLLDRNGTAYLTWLDTLTPEQLDSLVETPFFTMPRVSAIAMLAEHLRGHVAQMDYIQTIYGDHDWHMSG